MRLLHTMIRTGNLDRSIAFYTDVLGMRLLRRQDYPEGKFTLAFVGYGDEAGQTVDLAAESECELVLQCPSRRRGWCQAGRITIETRYPLGLFRAWSYWQPAMSALVYPRPAGGHLEAPPGLKGTGEGRPADLNPVRNSPLTIRLTSPPVCNKGAAAVVDRRA